MFVGWQGIGLHVNLAHPMSIGTGQILVRMHA